MHRTIIVVDIEGFGVPSRTMPHQIGARAGLYKVVEEAFDAAYVPWDLCRTEDRGDAVFILVPPDVPKASLVEAVPGALARAVQAHNHTSHEQQRVRLRIAIHAGEVAHDDHGVTSTAVTTTFRLLDAPLVKQALADSPGVVALIVSRWVFDEVVRHSTVLDPARFRPIVVEVKETRDTAWIALPDQPYTADPTVLDQPGNRTGDQATATGAVVRAGSIHKSSAAESAVGTARTAKVLAPALVPPLDEQLRLLATASRNQWTAAANERRLLHPAPLPIRWHRPTTPVAGPDSAATYMRFDPLPGLTAVNSSGLREGDQDTLYRIYGGLPSGRLLLIGPPGSGKSSAAILLLLDALHYREQATPDDQAQIPVPVLFTLHGWRPGCGEPVTDWVAGKLAETYPMFRSRAGRRAATDLLAAGRVAVLLDGLDEIPESVRPGVLAALADAPFRLVLLTRTAEAVAAAHHGPLAGAVAVELQPVQPADAATYLLQPLVNPPPAPWKTISDHLAEVADHRLPGSALSEALNTPLALSLLRDVYDPTGPVDELLDTSRFPSAADIENHLLDQAITAAYTPRPGHPIPRYTVATAHRTLRYLATQLTDQHTSDLAWWHIPTWTTHRSRAIRIAIANMLLNGLIPGFDLGLSAGFGPGLWAGLVFGLMTGLTTLFALSAKPFRGVSITPKRITRLTYRNASHSVGAGLMTGLSSGLLAGFSAGFSAGFPTGLVSGVSVGLAAGLAVAALFGLTRHTEVDDSSLGPADIWHHDMNAGLVYLLAVGIVFGLLAALTVRLVPGLASGLASGLEFRLSFLLPLMLLAGLLYGGLVAAAMAKRVSTAASAPGAATIDTAAALPQLTIQHKIPLRLIAFLEDARNRHLLRTVGPVYQFRHAKLQARLAHPPNDRPASSGLTARR